MSDTIEHQKTPDAHATLVGGSSAKRLLNCTASVGILERMQAQLDAEADAIVAQADALPATSLEAAPAMRERAEKLRASLNKSSTYADEGTALHEVMAYIVDNDIQRNDIINDPGVQKLWAQYEIEDARHWDCVIPAFDAFEKKCEELLAETDDPDYELLIRVEAECVMPGIVDKNGVPQFGSTDVLIRGPKRTVVWDWKFGAGVPVYASYKVERPSEVGAVPDDAKVYDEFGNDQLMYYATAASNTFENYFKHDTEEIADDWPVDLVICQPRVIEDGAISQFTTTYRDLIFFQLDLQEAVEEALGPNPQLKKGPWCRFEACKTVCPLHVSAAEKAALVGEKLGALALQQSTYNADPTSHELAAADISGRVVSYPEALATMLDIADIIEPYIKEAQSQAHAYLEAGGSIPGYKLVPKRAGHDKWKEDRKKVDAFLARKGLDLDTRREQWEPISPAQARIKLKAAGADMKDGSKDRIALEKLVAPGVSSGSTLAPSDDPRPNFIRSADRVAALADKLKGIAGA